MPHAARPSIHVKPSAAKKGNGPRNIPDFSRKPKPQPRGKPHSPSAKSGRRGK